MGRRTIFMFMGPMLSQRPNVGNRKAASLPRTNIGALATGPKSAVPDADGSDFTAILASLGRIVEEANCVAIEWSSVSPRKPQLTFIEKLAPF